MSDIKIFEKEEFGSVRVIMQDNDPWFVAKDICDTVELSVRDSVRYLDDEEKSYVPREHIGLPPGKNIIIINESGLYSLILRSRKPEAKKFKKWVTSEVLPSIRKTGSYSMQQLSPAEMLVEQAKMLVELEKKANKALETSQHVSNRLDQIETANDHFTVMGYSSLNKLHLPLQKAVAYGKKASIFCKENNIEMGVVPDPRFGRVNTYPLYVLQQIVDEE